MRVTEASVEVLDFAKGAGLLPAVVQHAGDGRVLMVGCMDAAALRETLRRGRVVFWSRSKGRLWEKGETSGHHLHVAEVHADCDRDALLVLARPEGPTCHEGTPTCFGAAAPAAAGSLHFLAALEALVAGRAAGLPAGAPAGEASGNASGSYTARLLAAGPSRCAQKVGEEGVEVALAGAAGSVQQLVEESADLVYHLLVLLRARGSGLAAVAAELERRHAARA
ncbi:MAG: bifunctional phosphoribosyl-AMP cyclohydrolase/phosphoribosyl-ATP diphosphatase HisIE [Planctomycetia bacterium]